MGRAQLVKQVRVRRVESNDGFDGTQFMLFAPDDPEDFAENLIEFLHQQLPWSRFSISSQQPAIPPFDSEGRSGVLIQQTQPRYTFEKIFVSFVVWQNSRESAR